MVSCFNFSCFNSSCCATEIEEIQPGIGAAQDKKQSERSVTGEAANRRALHGPSSQVVQNKSLSIFSAPLHQSVSPEVSLSTRFSNMQIIRRTSCEKEESQEYLPAYPREKGPLSFFSAKILNCIAGYLQGTPTIRSFSEEVLRQVILEPSKRWYITRDLYSIAKYSTMNQKELEIQDFSVGPFVFELLAEYYPKLASVELSCAGLNQNSFHELQQVGALRFLKHLALVDCQSEQIIDHLQKGVSLLYHLQGIEFFDMGMNVDHRLLTKEKLDRICKKLMSFYHVLPLLKWVRVDSLFFVTIAYAKEKEADLKMYQKIGQCSNVLILQLTE